MKHLLTIMMVLSSLATLTAQSYNGVADSRFRGAVLYSGYNFTGSQRTITQVGSQVTNFTPRSIRVYGGYKVEYRRNGQTISIDEDDHYMPNQPTGPYTLRTSSKLFVAILYSGPNQSGNAWFIEANQTLQNGVPEWDGHYSSGNPRSIKLLDQPRHQANNVLIGGQNGVHAFCGGSHTINGGIRRIRVSRNNCTPTNPGTPQSPPGQNPATTVTFYSGPNQTGQSVTLGAGTHPPSAIPFSTIRSARLPGRYNASVNSRHPSGSTMCARPQANGNIVPNSMAILSVRVCPPIKYGIKKGAKSRCNCR
ncbi:MAG: hypothetical protein KTR24_18320 [Saprospiraceae bacterium]|nr:hypothetical protein [Saprospiraceae bacterium]